MLKVGSLVVVVMAVRCYSNGGGQSVGLVKIISKVIPPLLHFYSLSNYFCWTQLLFLSLNYLCYQNNILIFDVTSIFFLNFSLIYHDIIFVSLLICFLKLI